MSEKLTTINIKGLPTGHGRMEWGEKTIQQMISAYRAYADDLRKIVKAIDETPDDEFIIKVIRGPYKQDLVKVLQEPVKVKCPIGFSKENKELCSAGYCDHCLDNRKHNNG